MLLNSPRQVEKQCPRWWSMAALGSLLTVAVLFSGVSVQADEDKPKEEKIIILRLTEKDGKFRVEAVTEKDQATDKKGDAKDDGDHKIVVRVVQDGKSAPVIVNTPTDKVHTYRVVKNLNDDGQSQRIKELEEALKRVQEAAKNAGAQLPDDARKQLDVLQKQLDEVRKQADVEAQKARLAADEARKNARLAVARMHVDSSRGRLGVQVQPPSAVLAEQLDLGKGQGMVIESVLPDSAAAKAGLQPNDILLAINDKPVSSDASQFVKQVADIKANSPFDAVVLRKGKKTSVKGITLPEASKEGKDKAGFFREADLDIKGIEFKAIELKDLDGFMKLENLKGGIKLENIDLKNLQDLKKLEQLKDLKFEFKDLDGLKNLDKLKDLRIELKNVDQLKKLEDLKELQLENVEPKDLDKVKRERIRIIEAGPQGGIVVRGAPNSVTMTVIRSDDHFTTRQQEGALVISVTGDIADGNSKVKEIVIRDGDEEIKYGSADKVPERYRDKVKNLVEMTEKGQFNFESKSKD